MDEKIEQYFGGKENLGYELNNVLYVIISSLDVESFTGRTIDALQTVALLKEMLDE